ncbi:uncharacterized protein LOC111677886 isoform X1 [Lucilia cuprina]|uniref:uncharacterized protein LOC111677886 isoform X1 n=1 Tax=Lucilia cuprina TaxID=7375 RepID=UPI001F056AFB|nr:uncharacterized protein LOC111677886 isoform X1 [Lucilia cuprina]
MRAHFASDIPASPDTDDGLQSPDAIDTKEPQPKVASVNETENLLQDRILEFKSDSSKMAVVGEFIDDVLQKAEEEANKQQKDKHKNSQQGKNKTQKQSFAIPDFKNGKVVNRARGFVVRLFESICNCANNAAAAPVTRFKFRSGKRASTSGDVSENNGKVENNKKEEKSKRNSNGGKKNDKAKIDETNAEKDNEAQETIELQ